MSTLATTAPLWITARGAGIAALLSASGALCAGLLMGLKPAFLAMRRLELRASHEALAVATFVLILVHAVTLLLDPVLHLGITGLLVPFGASWERIGTGLGQVAAYGMIALGATFYARRRLGAQRWRRAHRWIPVFWVLSIGHALMTGTDAGTWWFLAALAAPVLAGLALLGQRHLGAGTSPRTAASPPARP